MTFGRPKPWTRPEPLVAKPSTRRLDDKGPTRSAAHRAKIRALPCMICKPGTQTTPTRAHHAKAALPAMLGKKIDDYAELPLCDDHHTTGKDRLHRIGAPESAFWAKHGINPADAICKLLARLYPNPSEDVSAALKALQLRRAA